MEKVLHILRTPPDETVARLIEQITRDGCATVTCLYEDAVSKTPVDWCRLVEDIFSHQKVICWW